LCIVHCAECDTHSVQCTVHTQNTEFAATQPNRP